MNKRAIVLSVIFGFGLMQVNESKAFIGLAVRVGMFYTTYKFIDGISHGSISRFVDKYIDGPIDFVYSFGKGSQTFGRGFRAALGDFFKDEDRGAFGRAWDNLKNKFDYAVFIAKEEWSIRREASRAKKAEMETKIIHPGGAHDESFLGIEPIIEPEKIVPDQGIALP